MTLILAIALTVAGALVGGGVGALATLRWMGREANRDSRITPRATRRRPHVEVTAWCEPSRSPHADIPTEVRPLDVQPRHSADLAETAIGWPTGRIGVSPEVARRNREERGHG